MHTNSLFKNIGIGASKALLISLFVGATVIAPGGVQGTFQVLNRFFEGKEEPDYSRKQIEKALRYLRGRKLIDIQRHYEKDVFVLTKPGWFRARKLANAFGIPQPKKWDKKWRLVIFDIPNRRKDAADVFRQQLKRLGLANLQKSIWVHPYECKDQVFYLADNLFIKPYVRYILAEKIMGEEDLTQRFAL